MVLRSIRAGRRLCGPNDVQGRVGLSLAVPGPGLRSPEQAGWAMHGGRIEAEDEVTFGFRNGRTVQDDLKLE